MPISPYVRRLREHVGNELLLIASAGVLVRDGDGRLLLVRDADSHRLIILGGAIEIDESPAQAAVREAAEEASITVRITRLLGAVSGPEFRVRYPNGDETAYVSNRLRRRDGRRYAPTRRSADGRDPMGRTVGACGRRPKRLHPCVAVRDRRP
jgi:8-oxo-dGTP pyrophosphatase MutT (NUDIX family)